MPYASPHTVCPAGSISPGSAADWPRLHAQHSFLASLSSADHPEVSANQLHQELALRKSTMRVSLIGGSSFVAFLVLLGAAGLFRPRIAAALLRTMDVPPISGGPGMSRVGGFFTIVWIWFYSTIVVALVMQFLLYNSDTIGSLNPTANNHIQTTSFTLQVHMRLHGLAPEHVLRRRGGGARPDPFFDLAAAQQALADELPGYSDLSTGAHGAVAATAADAAVDAAVDAAADAAADAVHSGCGAAVSLFSDGLEMSNSRKPRINCSAADDGASTEIDFECVECNLASSQIDLRFSLASRFAMAQAIEWQAAVRWSQQQPVHGRSELRGLLVPSCRNCLLRGEAPSLVSLSLVPTVYENSINDTIANGFRMQYLTTTVGSTVEPEQFHKVPPSLQMRFKLEPFPQVWGGGA